MIGTKDQVIYSGLATKADATALGNALKSSQYFQEHGASVLFNKGFGSTTVSFVVQDGIWNQTGVLSSFEEACARGSSGSGRITGPSPTRRHQSGRER
jgi:hypothetical protein